MMMQCTLCSEIFSSLYRAKPEECPKCSAPAVAVHAPTGEHRRSYEAEGCEVLTTSPRNQES